MANGEVIGRVEDGIKKYYYRDMLGSIRSVVDSSNTVLEAYDYYPFGLIMPERTHVTGSGAETRERFTGKERDFVSSLDYFGARYYMPAIGRWKAVDPLGQYPSPYVYAGNNPLAYVDPTGLWAQYIAVRPDGRGGLIIEPGDTLQDLIIFLGGDRQRAEEIWEFVSQRGGITRDDGGRQVAWGYFRVSTLDLAVIDASHQRMLADVVMPGGGSLRSGLRKALASLFGKKKPNVSKITFGNNPNQEYHTFRHTDKAGLDRTTVRNAVRSDVEQKLELIQLQTPFNQSILVEGKRITYTAYLLPDGTLNIGRITVF